MEGSRCVLAPQPPLCQVAAELVRSSRRDRVSGLRAQVRAAEPQATNVISRGIPSPPEVKGHRLPAVDALTFVDARTF